MSKIKNIVKILILIAIMLLVEASYVFAQSNIPGGPYIDSWHQYEVTMGSGSSYDWTLYPTSADAIAETNGISLSAQGWVSLSDDGSTASIEIKFVDATFDALETWYLVYAEYSDDVCIARRSSQIDIAANSFFLDVDAGTYACNSFTNTVWDNGDGSLNTPEQISTVQFTINMNKASDFATDGWSCSGSLAFQTSNSYDFAATIFTITSGSSTAGTWNLTDNGGGSFDLDVTADGDGDTSDAVTITVQVEGEITEDFELRLTISGGQAESGDPGTYVVVTDDNGTGTKISDQTVFGIPNTSEISLSP